MKRNLFSLIAFAVIIILIMPVSALAQHREHHHDNGRPSVGVEIVANGIGQAAAEYRDWLELQRQEEAQQLQAAVEIHRINADVEITKIQNQGNLNLKREDTTQNRDSINGNNCALLIQQGRSCGGDGDGTERGMLSISNQIPGRALYIQIPGRVPSENLRSSVPGRETSFMVPPGTRFDEAWKNPNQTSEGLSKDHVIVTGYTDYICQQPVQIALYDLTRVVAFKSGTKQLQAWGADITPQMLDACNPRPIGEVANHAPAAQASNRGKKGTQF